MSNKISEALLVAVLALILGTFIAMATYCIINCWESPEWKDNRNRHRKYDPIKKEDINYINSTE